MTIEDLFNMKINKQNYLEVNQSTFIAVCSFCLNDITSSNDLILCGTEDYLFKLSWRKPCHHIVNNIHYCHNCVIVNKSTDKYNTERVLEEDYNDDCVTIFGSNVVDDDAQFIANTLIGFGGNTLFNGLLDFNAVEDFVVPPCENPDCLPISLPIEYNTNDNVSVGSKLSEDLSESIPVNDNIKQYLMKGGTCDIKSCNSKTFKYVYDFFIIEKLN